MGAGGWLGMTGFGAGLNRTGWPNASCTGPRVNTWRFGSTCDARLEEVDALVGGIACVGAVPAVPAGAAGCWAVNSGPDGQATQATVRIEVASQLVTTTAVGNRVVFMDRSLFISVRQMASRRCGHRNNALLSVKIAAVLSVRLGSCLPLACWLARRACHGSVVGSASRVSSFGIAGDAVLQKGEALRSPEEVVDALEELTIEQRELKQPGQLADLRERHVDPQDSPNWVKERQASRNRYEATRVGHQHVLAGTGDGEEVLHRSDQDATVEDCSRTNDVAAAN